MLTLLSPAKKLDLEPERYLIHPTEPLMAGQAKILAREAKKQSVSDLRKLMGISDNLAVLNVDRFKSFRLAGGSNSAKAAVLTFDGDVYWGLAAKTLHSDEMAFAQDHVRILSGLYGVLRPMDKIQPYRLEMGVRLTNPRGKNLYEFWGDRIAKSLKNELKSHSEKTVMNLASNEYFRAVDVNALGFPVINASFLDIKHGKARSLMFYAKRARGLMARWIIENRIDTVGDLCGFNAEGYKIDSTRSDDGKLVFIRKQPPPKND